MYWKYISATYLQYISSFVPNQGIFGRIPDIYQRYSGHHISSVYFVETWDTGIALVSESY